MILIYRTISKLIQVIEVSIVIRIVLSFLNASGGGIISKIIYEITEPILGPSRYLLSKLKVNTGMFDFSPLVAILILNLLRNFTGMILL